jgi:hypothetical protein
LFGSTVCSNKFNSFSIEGWGNFTVVQLLVWLEPLWSVLHDYCRPTSPPPPPPQQQGKSFQLYLFLKTTVEKRQYQNVEDLNFLGKMFNSENHYWLWRFSVSPHISFG